MPFVFNKDYKDKEQVREYMPVFLSVYDEITSAGRFTSNSTFKGRIPGIEGPDEDTAIYLLQTLKRLDELEAKVAAALADGFRPLVGGITAPTKFAKVVEYGFYVGGTGWHEWSEARVVPLGERSCAVLPKGKRTNGHLLRGKVLVKR